MRGGAYEAFDVAAVIMHAAQSARNVARIDRDAL